MLRVFHYGDVDGISTARRNGHREIRLTWYGRPIEITVIDGAGAFAELLDELRQRAESPHPESGAAPMRQLARQREDAKEVAMKTILVGTDGSHGAQVAVRRQSNWPATPVRL